jgi:hypothetical protein
VEWRKDWSHGGGFGELMVAVVDDGDGKVDDKDGDEEVVASF